MKLKETLNLGRQSSRCAGLLCQKSLAKEWEEAKLTNVVKN